MDILTLDDTKLTELLCTAINGNAKTSKSITCLGPTYVALRRQGNLQQAYWRYERDLGAILEGIVSHMCATFPLSPTTPNQEIDAIELGFTYNYRLVKRGNFQRVFANVHRGIRGIELQYKDKTLRYSPTRALAGNLSFPRALDIFLAQESLSADTFFRQGGIVQAFEARQVLIQLHPEVSAITMHRGNRIFPLQELSQEELGEMVTTMAHWLLRQVKEDGRMTYKYFPSRGQESTSNNLIRQFMATLSLIRYAKFTNRPDHWVLAAHNLNYNLKKFYRIEGEIGVIEYDGKVKLGAIALAALAILEYSDQQEEGKIPSTYADIFARLCKCIDRLWQPNGSFRTFYQPKKRNDNQNFYPGEALLFWASLYQRDQDANLLKRCYQSFYYYREWHRQHRNPAFIPWHTQAYSLLYNATKNSQFLEFIWEMNDWLLSMQQWDGTRYQDLPGRFYNPEHPEYGPPHASSTGVYLEGLADAYQLAIGVGDLPRAQNYERVIWRGIRSVRQLQFRDDIDFFYISKRAPVHGGIRTEVYDNSIRVDNVQHCLMALLKLYQLPEFNRQPPTRITVANSPQPPLVFSTPNLPSNLQNFRLLDPEIEIQPLLAEIENNSHLWLRDTSRQDKVKVQRETNTIYLRSAVKPFPPGITSANDVHESHPTKTAEKFPKVFSWVKGFTKSIGGELGRVTIVRLAAHGRVYRHIDRGAYYQLRDRYHLVLHSPAGSLLGAGEEWVRMKPGELWWFDNKKPHEAINEADDWRIHLIFDVLNNCYQ